MLLSGCAYSKCRKSDFACFCPTIVEMDDCPSFKTGFQKKKSKMANNVDPDETAKVVSSGSTLFEKDFVWFRG